MATVPGIGEGEAAGRDAALAGEPGMGRAGDAEGSVMLGVRRGDPRRPGRIGVDQEVPPPDDVRVGRGVLRPLLGAIYGPGEQRRVDGIQRHVDGLHGATQLHGLVSEGVHVRKVAGHDALPASGRAQLYGVTRGVKHSERAEDLVTIGAAWGMVHGFSSSSPATSAVRAAACARCRARVGRPARQLSTRWDPGSLTSLSEPRAWSTNGPVASLTAAVPARAGGRPARSWVIG